MAQQKQENIENIKDADDELTQNTLSEDPKQLSDQDWKTIVREI